MLCYYFWDVCTYERAIHIQCHPMCVLCIFFLQQISDLSEKKYDCLYVFGIQSVKYFDFQRFFQLFYGRAKRIYFIYIFTDSVHANCSSKKRLLPNRQFMQFCLVTTSRTTSGTSSTARIRCTAARSTSRASSSSESASSGRHNSGSRTFQVRGY